MDLSESIKKYISLYKQCIIIISGFNGCRKTKIIKDLMKELNLPSISYQNFIDKDKYTDLWNYDCINWDDFIQEINKNKSTGILIDSPIFKSENKKFICDLHINYYMNKDYFRRLFDKHNLSEEQKKEINTKIMPYYYEVTKLSHFDKSIDISNIDYQEQLKQTVDFIKIFLERKINPIKKNEDDEDFGSKHIYDSIEGPFNIPPIKNKRQKLPKIHGDIQDTNTFLKNLNDFMKLDEKYGYTITMNDLKNQTQFYKLDNGDESILITAAYHDQK